MAAATGIITVRSLAWDDPYYDYSALKALNYQLTYAPLSKADTFYFAIMKPDDSEDKLAEATIDHTSLWHHAEDAKLHGNSNGIELCKHRRRHWRTLHITSGTA